jgi:hypothetical protein
VREVKKKERPRRRGQLKRVTRKKMQEKQRVTIFNVEYRKLWSRP